MSASHTPSHSPSEQPYPTRLKDFPTSQPLSRKIFWMTIFGAVAYCGAAIWFVLLEKP